MIQSEMGPKTREDSNQSTPIRIGFDQFVLRENWCWLSLNFLQQMCQNKGSNSSQGETLLSTHSLLFNRLDQERALIRSKMDPKIKEDSNSDHN